MPDEHTEAAAPEATEGAQPSGGTASSKLTRAEQDAIDREAFLSGAWEEDADEEAPAAKPAKKAEPKKAAAVDDEDEDETEDVAKDEDEEAEEIDDDLDDDEEDDSESEEDDDEESTAGKADPELAKRLAKVQKYEKRVREQAEARERQFVQERDAFIAEWKPKIEASEAFEKLKARKSDVVGVLKAIGYSDDDFADISKITWALSKEGGSDPKNRDAVARMQRERELREKNDALEARLAGLEEKLTKRETDAAADREVEAYMGRVKKAVGDNTPLVRKRMELAPKSTNNALLRVAFELAKKTGERVDPRKVARAYEKKLERQRELAAKLADAEAPSSGSSTTSPKKKSSIVVEDKTKQKNATTTAPKNGSHGAVIPSREEMIEDLRRIDRGELDPERD